MRVAYARGRERHVGVQVGAVVEGEARVLLDLGVQVFGAGVLVDLVQVVGFANQIPAFKFVMLFSLKASVGYFKS